jgi:predicted phage tail protein
MAKPLESLRTWLVHNNATVMAVLLLVIGVTMIGKGIRQLLAQDPTHGGGNTSQTPVCPGRA